MGEQDEQVSHFGNWGSPSPNTSGFFSSTLENNNDSSGLVNSEFLKPEMFSQQRMNSRVGLSERIAARAGFNAPRLNTEGVRPSGVSQNRDLRSPFLTIPPGLSPTSLLESPVFLSNQMAQPSPTTGQLPFSFGGMNTNNFSFSQEIPEKSRGLFYDNANSSSFAFKPVPDSGPSSFLGPTNNNFPGFEISKGTSLSADMSSPPDEEGDEQPIGSEPLPGGPPADDGYNWRKYGQKQVKGSEYPRSYYKCTHPNCPVKKKVERSQEGHITEIIYKGAHIHAQPAPSRRTGMGLISDLQGDSVEVTSSASLGAENLQVQNGNRYESGDIVDGPSDFPEDDNEEDDRVTHGSASLGYDAEEDENESKRRKLEAYTAADMSGATRAIREPRVVVQTTSEVDILDDGYRWRKYGQKVVKGNPNPRSYYKCTHAGCTVRKHVERASHDLKSVITTYEGKHNHEVPAARNTSHHNSVNNNNNGPAHQSPAHQQSLLHTAMARFDGPNSFGRPQFGFGMGQPALANLAMAGLGPNSNNFVAGPNMGQQQNYYNNDMGFMLPKGEPKIEPFADGSSIYPQMMNRLPLGP